MTDEKRKLEQELTMRPIFDDQHPSSVGHPYAGRVADWILMLLGRIKRLDGQVREAERRLDDLQSGVESNETRLDVLEDTEGLDVTRFTLSDLYQLKQIFDPDAA